LGVVAAADAVRIRDAAVGVELARPVRAALAAHHAAKLGVAQTPGQCDKHEPLQGRLPDTVTMLPPATGTIATARSGLSSRVTCHPPTVTSAAAAPPSTSEYARIVFAWSTCNA